MVATRSSTRSAFAICGSFHYLSRLPERLSRADLFRWTATQLPLDIHPSKLAQRAFCEATLTRQKLDQVVVKKLLTHYTSQVGKTTSKGVLQSKLDLPHGHL